MFLFVLLAMCGACALGNRPLMTVPAAAPSTAPPSSTPPTSLKEMVARAQSLDLSEWYHAKTYVHMCPNGFGFYGWVDDVMVATCESHRHQHMKHLTTMQESRAASDDMENKWSMKVNNHNASRTVYELCDACNPCERFDYSTPDGVCCQGCLPGFYAVEHCASSHAASVCEACPLGTYKSNSDLGTTSHRERCYEHTTCPENTHARGGVFAASEVRDVFCDPDEGYYCAGVQQGASCSSPGIKAGCPSGSYMFMFPDRETSALCSTCDSKTEHVYISPRSGLARCVKHTQCERVQEKGTLTKDTVCLQLKHEEL